MSVAGGIRIPVATRRRAVLRRPGSDAFALFRVIAEELGARRVFLLDSVSDPRERHRLAIVAADPVLELRFKRNRIDVTGDEALVDAVKRRLAQERLVEGSEIAGDPAEVLAAVSGVFAPVEDLPAFAGGFLGYVAYDAIRYFERLPHTTVDDRQLDDIRLQVHRSVVHVTDEGLEVFAHRFGEADDDLDRVLGWIDRADRLPDLPRDVAPVLSVKQDVTEEEFVRRVEKAKNYIADGDIFQIVPSMRIQVNSAADPLVVYDRLRRCNPSPFMFYADYGDSRIFGASPEVQLRVQDGVAQMRPIAGTSKGKGKTAEENRRLVEDLLGDEKERAEHLMLVDLCRNDLGRVCRPGTVVVEQLMVVEEYSHVFHIVSHVRGELRPEVKPLQAILATFPAGTLSGTPKVRAMEIIDELESFDRGPYGGAVGFIDWRGNVNLAIMIRSVVQVGDVFYLQAGAGIVADSVPEMEWRECGHKLAALHSALFPA
ncbi:anthranilate synthase component I family protein [Kyrpidia tusciae]|uniref:Anthranilate synthase n=1 Tax=Kyrpidia tusciae (strain DSM 2912 / NBRC 15312 / T2) TaxID=562970 RepID=D5WQK1_KYRT2|nr:anthranilate synthase component I family protein [Kyrpidia tusciae]ADG06610.1 Anthranilate synthase [Kyrpidia tusciae DSM 2912]